MAQSREKNDRLPIFRENLYKLMGDMSITEFAGKVGLSRQTMGFYLNGDRIPDAETLVRICEKCNISSDWLLGLSGDRNRQPCAVDELGLSSNAVQNIAIHRHIPQIMHGLNTLLESEKFMCFLSEIYLLSCYIGDEIERLEKKAAKITSPLLGVSKMLHISGNDAYVMRSLAEELNKSHPELNGRIVVSYGDGFIKTKFGEIEMDFDSILKETTRYTDLQELKSDLENDYGND